MNRSCHLRRAFRVLRALCCALAGLLLMPADAQTTWQRDEILSQYIVHDIVQSSAAGLLWVGTSAGVFRYDGYDAVPLATFVRTGCRAPSGLTKALLFDTAGNLWFRSEAGLFKFTPGTGQLAQVPLPSVSNQSSKIIQTIWQHPRSGALWVSYGRGMVITLDPATGQPYWKCPLLLPGVLGVNQITADSTGDGVWLTSTEHFIYQVTATGQRRRTLQSPSAFMVRLPGTRGLQFFDANALYEVDSSGLFHQKTQWSHATDNRLFSPTLADSTWHWLSEGYHWTLRQPRAGGSDGGGPNAPLATRIESGIRLIRPGSETQLVAADRYIMAYRLFRDRNRLWWTFSSSQRGCYKQRSAQRLVEALPMPVLSTRAVTRLPDGRLLVGTYGGVRIQPADSPHARLRPWPVQRMNLPGQGIPILRDVVVTRNRRVLFADEGASFGELDPRTGQLTYFAALDQKTDGAVCLLQDHRQRIWGGGLVGLYQLDPDQRTYRRFANADPRCPLHGLIIVAIAEDPAGVLWVSTEQGLYRVQPDSATWQRYGTGETGRRALPSDAVLCVWPDAATGHLWVGTRDAGLLELDPRRGVVRQFTARQGLPSPSVCTILPGARGTLWLGTFAGLVRFEMATGSLGIFTENDGLSSAELNSQSAWHDPTDGAFYFGGIAGMHRVLPSLRAPQRLRPHLLITALHATDSVQLAADPTSQAVLPALQFDAVGGELDLDLATTDFFAPNLTHYRYRLTLNGERSGAFQPLGANRRLHLQSISPGDYTLEITAETAQGLATGNQLRAPLWVRAVWWQRPVVWISTLLLLAVATYAGFQVEVNRLRREHALRARIAADLHDEVGALLTRVNLQAELAVETGPETTPRQFADLLEDSRAAVATMRDVVWSIDTRSDTVISLTDRMRDHLGHTAGVVGLPTDFNISGFRDDDVLSPHLRQHLYLIFKEAVTNVVRHAPTATLLQIALTRDRGRLKLVIENDGPIVGVPTRVSGMGLRNLRSRAAALGAALEAAPRPEGGWRVLVVCA